MAIPKLSTLQYELTLPIAKKKVKFRPFYVIEEKPLLMAKESKDEKLMATTMRDIVEKCTFGKVTGDKFSTVDLVYSFLIIRTKSAGEQAPVRIPCSCSEEGGADVNIDLTDLNVKIHDVNNTIEIGDDQDGRKIMIKLKHISFDDYVEISESNSDYMSIKKGTEDVYFEDDGESFQPDDWTDKEWEDFYSTLPSPAYKKIAEYFGNSPELSMPINANCDQCGKDLSREVKETGNFI